MHNVATIVKEKLHKSQADRLREKYETNANMAMRCLNMNGAEYQIYVISCAESFLNYMCLDYPEAKYNELMQSDTFWNWFTNQWNLRDEAFMVQHRVQEVLEMNIDGMIKTTEHMYRGMHFLALMTSGMRNSFLLMLGDIIRERFKRDTTDDKREQP